MELWSRRKFFITSLAGSAVAGVNKLFGQARPQPAEGRQPPVRYTDYVEPVGAGEAPAHHLQRQRAPRPR